MLGVRTEATVSRASEISSERGVQMIGWAGGPAGKEASRADGDERLSAD